MKAVRSWIAKCWKRWGLAILIIVFVVLGVVGLQTAVGWWPALAGLAVVLLAAFAKFNEIAGRVVGSVVIATLVLVGVNVVVDNFFDWVGLPRPQIVVGLFFAIGVFSVAAGWYLRGNEEQDSALGRGNRWGLWITSVVAVALAVFLIVDVPIIAARSEHSVASIVVGVLAALVLCSLGFWCTRKRNGVPGARRIGGIAAPVLGLLALGFVPITLQQATDSGGDVPKSRQLNSKVDVRIVTDGSSHPAPARVVSDPSLERFDVRYSVGFADGNGVRWTLVDSPNVDKALRVASLGRGASIVDARPVTREDADSVLALLVDGTAPVIGQPPEELLNVKGATGEVGRWRRVAHAARESKMPTFALLQAKGQKGRERLAHWAHFTRNGGVVSLQILGLSAATDAGLALAIGAPTARADLALAIVHRPLLLFDTTEPVPRPISVEWLFREGRVRVCHDGGVTKTKCDRAPTTNSSLLENDNTHLQLTRPKPSALRDIARREAAEAAGASSAGARAAGAEGVLGSPPSGVPAPSLSLTPAGGAPPDTAIYVHPVPIEQNGKSLLYLDYWWYLPDNPVTVGLKAFCGAGLVIPGITCHDHQSDWEGMTVVVDRTLGTPRVLSVHYAEHNEVVEFPWKQLRERWNGDRELKTIIESADNGAQRPLAFIASGTHSSYPIPCRTSGCTQFATATGEDSYRGGLPWIGNFTNVCGAASCVQPLPTREGGRQPALWNAFAGTWGEQRCALTYYCDSAEPPPAPGQQKRYKHPTRCTGIADAAWRFQRQQCGD
jgi:hypothetical protein